MEIQSTACLIARESNPSQNLALINRMLDVLPLHMAGLFLCIPDACVLIGKKQDPELICADDVTILQRESGGGAVYTDKGCVGYALMIPKSLFDIPFQTQILVRVFLKLGLPVLQDSRGALWYGDRCLCVNTYYKGRNHAYQEGILYVNSDLEKAASLLNKDQPNHYLNLSELRPSITPENVIGSLYQSFCECYGYEPTLLDEGLLNAGASRNSSSACLRTKNDETHYSFEANGQYSWGNLCVRINEDHKVIRKVEFWTDAFEIRLFDYISQHLEGCIFLISAIQQRFEELMTPILNPRLMQITEDVQHLICAEMSWSHKQRRTQHLLAQSE